MAKKEPVPFNNSEELDAFDQELSEAMADLDGANARIEELLSGIQPPDPSAVPAAYSEEAGQDEDPEQDQDAAPGI